MKFLRALAAALLCCLLLYIPALALSTATEIAGSAAVAEDGSCLVELTVTVQLDTARSDLTFPLPENATDVLLNGQSASTISSGGKRLISLSGLPAGRSTFLVRYRLSGVVSKSKGATMLSLPVLTGFSLPIAQLSITVTIPGPITGRPVFYSGYYQDNIRLDTEITENTLVASTTEALKDHETLRLEMEVDGALFDLGSKAWLSWWDGACLCLLALAIGYFALTLMPKFYRRSRSYTPPEGITAGEVGCCLTGSGTDLSMMVLSWAQLGYLQLELDGRGRVLLHKRMEMGNERSYHEGRIFQILFGRRDTVDATSAHYTRIYRKVAGRSPLQRQIYAPRSGDVRIFTGICCLAGFCSGMQLYGGNVFLRILLGLAAAAFCFGIHAGCKCIPLRHKLPLLIAIGCGCLWIGLGSLLGRTGWAIFMTLFQTLSGIGAAYGGKRSESGQRMLTQLLGLRQHMLRAGSFDLQQLQLKNPNYFYERIPYALAMGIDRQFARRFDHKKPLPECLWLRGAPRMTAPQCAARLRHIADILDKARYRKV